MPNDLMALADKVREDSVSGSSETAVYVLNSLHRILTDNEPSREQLLEFSNVLRKAKPAMAPLSNIARMIETAARSNEPDRAALLSVERVIGNERTALTRIAENATEKIEGTVLTLSYSGTVLKVLETIAKNKEIRVVVAESLPLGEGRRTAELLSGSGIDVTLISDSMVYAEARDSDLCLVGADAITPQALINKVGTYGIALASVQAGIPTFVVSSTLKIASELRPEWNIEQTSDGEIKVRSQIFEPTPLELIAEVITEQGSSRPDRLFRSFSQSSG
jgi:ribose 1,5-bisphosphate isomerase